MLFTFPVNNHLIVQGLYFRTRYNEDYQPTHFQIPGFIAISHKKHGVSFSCTNPTMQTIAQSVSYYEQIFETCITDSGNELQGVFFAVNTKTQFDYLESIYIAKTINQWAGQYFEKNTPVNHTVFLQRIKPKVKRTILGFIQDITAILEDIKFGKTKPLNLNWSLN